VLAKKTATKPTETSTASSDVGPAGLAAIASGLIANPVMLWSEYTLKTTGAGLPPGPGGALGALGEIFHHWSQHGQTDINSAVLC
jgi:hypothetical protein